MNVRARWMHGSLSQADLRAVLKVMRQTRYQIDERRDGFGIVDDAGDAIEGLYLRFVTADKGIVLPNGKKIPGERSTSEYSEFRLSCEEPAVEIRNTSKALPIILNAVVRAVPSFTVERYVTDPVTWFHAADATLRGGRVLSCTSEPFEVTNATYGRVQVNGNESVLERYHDLTQAHPAKVARLCVQWTGPKWDVRCYLHRDGTARFIGDSLDSCMVAVRRALVSPLPKATLPS